MIDVAIRRVRYDAVLPRQAYEGDAGLDLAACEEIELLPGERASRPHRDRRRDPGRLCGLARAEIRAGCAALNIVTSWRGGSISSSGHRGEYLRRPAEHRSNASFDRGARGARIAQLVVAPGGHGPARGDLGARHSATPGLVVRILGRLSVLEPRIRVSAILRWRGRVLLLRHQKAGEEVWLLPGGGVNLGESLLRALQRELWEETGLFPTGTDVPLEGPVALVDSIGPHTGQDAEARRARDLRRRYLPASLEDVSSRDSAVSGHRAFSLAELDAITVHPPIQRFLQRWQPGDPAGRRGRDVDALNHGRIGTLLPHTLTCSLPRFSRYDRSGWWAGVPRWNVAPSDALHGYAPVRRPRETPLARARRKAQRALVERTRGGGAATSAGKSSQSTARGCGGGAARGGTSRSRVPRGSPRSPTARRSQTRGRRGREARRPRRGAFALRGSLIPRVTRRAGLESAFEKDVPYHPRSPAIGSGGKSPAPGMSAPSTRVTAVVR